MSHKPIVSEVMINMPHKPILSDERTQKYIQTEAKEVSFWIDCPHALKFIE